MVFFITGCSKNESKDTKGSCKSTSVQLVFAVEKIYDNFKESNKNVKQHKLHLKIINTVDEIARNLIGKTGGVKRNGKDLFNSCASIDNLKPVFDDFVFNKLSDLYNQLDESDKSKEIKRELDVFFYGKEPYFDKVYFENKNITDLTFDLMTLELILIE